MVKSTIVWFRQDLRLEDHPAFTAAVERGDSIIPLYIWAPQEEGTWAPGAASRWWLHHSLESLSDELKQVGLNLILRSGNSCEVLKETAISFNAAAVFWNRRYEPIVTARDAKIKAELQKIGLTAQSFNGQLLFEPWTIANKQKKPFQVFTPFWKTCLAQSAPPQPLPIPKGPFHQAASIKSDSIRSLDLLPRIHWDAEIKKCWKPGALHAKKLFRQFLKQDILAYIDERDRPDSRGTSWMSPYLHFGEISPRMLWHSIKSSYPAAEEGAEGYLRQLGWREFAHHLLYHFPQTTDAPLRQNFSTFPWVRNNEMLKAWQQGATGYPMVDAGMRQLWKLGWMHNRVRMIVGSFLVKDLLISWHEGAKWFWDTLLDADLANNTLGWQWVGGCGADAAPYFRIFNPVTQGEKFDPEGQYVREWVPELSRLPVKWIHRPWEAPSDVLRSAGVTLGDTYPEPIVDHAIARERALAAFQSLRSQDSDARS